MFSQTNEYALRVITFLGATPKGLARNADIAEVTKVPVGYLYKILQILERAGLVRGQRGKHGGYSLNRPPTEISVLDVVNAVDPLPRIRTCPLQLRSHGVRLCPLHRRLDDAFAYLEDVFRKSLISDLLVESSESIPLCDSPGTEHPRKISLAQQPKKRTSAAPA